MRPAAALALGLGLLGAAAPARAEPCGRPDVRFARPADGARVPYNATLSAVYASSAEYLGEDILFAVGDTEPGALTGTFDATEGVLRADAPALEPLTTYTLTWPKLRGINTATLGHGAEVTFETTDAADVESPEFAGPKALTWQISRDRDECTESLEDRFHFELTLSAADDDGGRENLTLIVFQTAGPEVDATAPQPIALVPWPGDGRVIVKRAVSSATGRVCFSALVRDLTGRVSSGSRELCTETVAPPYFESCAVGAPGAARRAPAGPGSATGALLLGALGLGLARRRPGARRAAGLAPGR